MSEYKVPRRDISFVLNEVLDIASHYSQLPDCEDATPDIIEAILDEGGKFAERVLSPLNKVGDQQGCQLIDGVVKTPDGFKEAYQQFVEGGWPSLSHRAEWGGQGLPESLGIVISEMMGTANWSWSMYPGLSHGAMNTLEQHGTQQQKEIYLSKLVSGEWTGTMCLTEPHCGTDLGLLRTRAEPQDDGSYLINGNKIFISSGDHDMAENIVHIVLARLPDAPEGTKGISLFVVPKYLPDADGNVGEHNGVSCGSIEHKMGIHGNVTCALNFDNARGFLIGPENKGLNCMFTFMNAARLGTAVQGLAHAELGFQNSLTYARERLQMRSLTGTKSPEKPADAIIVHPEVRKMLLTQKAIAEGARALVYFTAMMVDRVRLSDDEKTRQQADALLAFITPIAKAFLTELGFESANLGMQVFGGHGYITEWGMEQNVRDSRISMLYEGTTQIQALDLLGRKVLKSKGASLKQFTRIIHLFCKEYGRDRAMKEFIKPLRDLNKEWGSITTKIGFKALRNHDEVGAASVDYLMYSGYVTLAYFWARMAQTAQQRLKQGSSEKEFYEAKIATARFYFQRLLPRTRGLVATMQSGSQNLMELDEASFAF